MKTAGMPQFIKRSHIRGRMQRTTWCIGPYAEVDFNLTLCPHQSRLQNIYHGQPDARVDFIPRSGTLDLASGQAFFHQKLKF
jgi:hypothetical protein